MQELNIDHPLVDSLNQLKEKFEQQVCEVKTSQELVELKSNYLGKTGEVSKILKGLKDLDPDNRKLIGPAANEIKQKMLEKINTIFKQIERDEINKKLMSEHIDLTNRSSVKANHLNFGSQHPISFIQSEIEDIFLSMGFDILEGPHIEDQFHNFEALNIPQDHPARDMQDTFWFHSDDVEASRRRLLRTHTSTVQVHGMLSKKPPFKFIAPGKVFRCERTDASHEMVFHQLEGMMVDRDVSVSHLIHFMKIILSEIFNKEVDIRLRPGFFPFVEPGFELDIKCLICNGKGCSVCKQVGWVELLPCGMVHPNVLKAGGIDPAQFNGFAFGLGLDRLVMMKYGIDDIRHFHGADLRFSSQFKNF